MDLEHFCLWQLFQLVFMRLPRNHSFDHTSLILLNSNNSEVFSPIITYLSSVKFFLLLNDINSRTGENRNLELE